MFTAMSSFKYNEVLRWYVYQDSSRSQDNCSTDQMTKSSFTLKMVTTYIMRNVLITTYDAGEELSLNSDKKCLPK